MKTVIAFPPWAGGNHVKNLLEFTEENFNGYLDLYTGKDKKVHAQEGSNLTKQKFDKNNILHGHFGEIMSLRKEFAEVDKRWILVSPDTYECRSILVNRGKHLTLDSYFDHEQIFLYEPHMFNTYFRTPMQDIMNISVYELFADDIDGVLDRLNFFLGNTINKVKAKELHKIWKSKV